MASGAENVDVKAVVAVLDVAVLADVDVQLSPIGGAGSRVLREAWSASYCNFHPQDQRN